MSNKQKLGGGIVVIILVVIFVWTFFYQVDPFGYFNHVGTRPMGDAN